MINRYRDYTVRFEGEHHEPATFCIFNVDVLTDSNRKPTGIIITESERNQGPSLSELSEKTNRGIAHKIGDIVREMHSLLEAKISIYADKKDGSFDKWDYTVGTKKHTTEGKPLKDFVYDEISPHPQSVLESVVDEARDQALSAELKRSGTKGPENKKATPPPELSDATFELSHLKPVDSNKPQADSETIAETKTEKNESTAQKKSRTM